MRLEINYENKKLQKTTNTQRLNSMVLNNQWVTDDIKEKIKEIPDDK